MTQFKVGDKVVVVNFDGDYGKSAKKGKYDSFGLSLGEVHEVLFVDNEDASLYLDRFWIDCSSVELVEEAHD